MNLDHWSNVLWGDDIITPRVYIGCAGWSVPGPVRDYFPKNGSHLQRYSATLQAVEINSSFYRPHRVTTYERWADETPESFRFSVKFPKQITHEARLTGVDQLTADFAHQTSFLRHKLGCYLIQLPPSLKFHHDSVARFFSTLRDLTDVPAVCEPRHRSWFTPQALDVLSSFQVDLVVADPKPVEEHSQFTHSRIVYLRLHGSPRIYYSRYDLETLHKVRDSIQTFHEQGREVWCLFDNTADRYAIVNALELREMLSTVWV